MQLHLLALAYCHLMSTDGFLNASSGCGDNASPLNLAAVSENSRHTLMASEKADQWPS